jgi:hypothetical protein|tara:strand:- start:9417 stop:11141 length:1725 start_codon:yes stop_codon:yes gene_type:complete
LKYFFNNLPFLFVLHFVSGITITATVDQKKIALDDVFEFKVEAIEGSELPQVDLSPLKKNFIVVNGPSQQTNISWINGKMTSIYGLSWTLSPKKTGTIVLPPLTVTTGKSKHKTKPIKLHVSKNPVSSKSENSQSPFIQVELDKNTAYLGEQITVTYQLFTRTDLSIESVDLPEFVGFWMESLYSPRQINMREVSLKGVRYKKAKLYTVALFPTKTGNISLPPYTINSKVYVEKKKSKRRDPFFDVFDSFSSREAIRKVIKSEIKTITVIPYPDGKPADFTGAVGNYTVRTSVDVQDVKANEAVTFYIEVKGTGNLSLFSLPELVFPKSLEVFPPVSEMNKDSFRDEITGTLRWEYVVIPRQSGRFNLPRVELSFFEPKTTTWKRAKAPSIQISVSPGPIPIGSPEGLTKQEVALLGKDIRYHRTIVPNWNKNKRLPVVAVLFYSIAICGFIFPGMVNKYQQKYFEGMDIRQSKNALKNALISLKNGGEDKFDICASVIYTYLKEKFYLQTDKLDPTTVQAILGKYIPEQEMDELIQLLYQCDAGRFSPQSTDYNSDIISTVISILKKIDKYDK